MPSWQFVAEPRACRPYALLTWAGHCLVAAAPWMAGCAVWLATVLSIACLAALPGALRGLPGPHCRVRGLGSLPAGYRVRLADGRWVPADIAAASRVLPGLVVCRLRAEGRRLEWWVPRESLPAAQFRRLKVAVRTAAPGGLARIGA